MPGLFSVGTRLTADVLNAATFRPYCKVHQTVAQTGLLTGATTVISFTTEDHDPEGWHDNVTNNSRITPNIAGDYEVTVEGAYAGTATITSSFTGIFLNGALASRSGNQKPNATSSLSAFTPTWVDVITCNGTTDYLEMIISFSGSANQDTNVSTTGQARFIVRYLGA